MRLRAKLIFLMVTCLFLLAATSDEVVPLLGYSAASSRTQRDWEGKFRMIPTPANLRDYMQRLSAQPHHVGSAYDKDNAEWMLSKFKEWGLDAHIEALDVLFPKPKERIGELVEPGRFQAKLQEPPVSGDPTSNQQSEQLPTYNAYSIDGDVTAPLVYVNYGIPEDYEKLEQMGISVKGAIAIARYGHSWRGIKPKVAAEHGAVGCLIYSDPRDDGYFEGDVFPQGAWRPPDGVQRGSVMDMTIHPGDPLTPDIGATKDAKRLALKDVKTFTRIPVLPISYGDAQNLLKQGWKPSRTIIYCVWDGEEPGLLGSTEWAETHADELRQHAAIYINTDANGRGYLSAGGSHTLEKFMNGVARDVEDPEKKISIWKRSQLKQIADASSTEERQEARQRTDLRIRAIGSGSDYTVFLDHLGIATLDLGFGDEDGGGIYHSIYDDFYWYTHFSDTDFSYGRALAQTVGTAVMRMADADLLPYEFTDFADTVHRYLGELQKLLKDKQDQVSERNKEMDEGVFSATADPKKTFVPPQREEVPPHLNFAPLENASEALTRSAERYQKAYEKVAKNGDLAMNSASLQIVNAKLLQSERKLASQDGLPGRPWFKHMIYAPGQYTGYGEKTIPGVREASEQTKWKEADDQIQRAAAVLLDEAALIDEAAQELERGR